jgi:hypothetical protein
MAFANRRGAEGAALTGALHAQRIILAQHARLHGAPL